jgi:hypothetical protein
MVEKCYPRPVTLKIKICFSWKKKADPGGAHWGISFEYKYFGKFEFISETDLGNQTGGWGRILINI